MSVDKKTEIEVFGSFLQGVSHAHHREKCFTDNNCLFDRNCSRIIDAKIEAWLEGYHDRAPRIKNLWNET